MRHRSRMGTVQMDDLRSASRIRGEGPRAVCEQGERERVSSPRSSWIASGGTGRNDELHVCRPPGPVSTRSTGVSQVWRQRVRSCKILWRIHVLELDIGGMSIPVLGNRCGQRFGIGRREHGMPLRAERAA
jgi:hypothetical protein